MTTNDDAPVTRPALVPVCGSIRPTLAPVPCLCDKGHDGNHSFLGMEWRNQERRALDRSAPAMIVSGITPSGTEFRVYAGETSVPASGGSDARRIARLHNLLNGHNTESGI